MASKDKEKTQMKFEDLLDVLIVRTDSARSLIFYFNFI